MTPEGARTIRCGSWRWHAGALHHCSYETGHLVAVQWHCDDNSGHTWAVRPGEIPQPLRLRWRMSGWMPAVVGTCTWLVSTGLFWVFANDRPSITGTVVPLALVALIAALGWIPLRRLRRRMRESHCWPPPPAPARGVVGGQPRLLSLSFVAWLDNRVPLWTTSDLADEDPRSLDRVDLPAEAGDVVLHIEMQGGLVEVDLRRPI